MLFGLFLCLCAGRKTQRSQAIWFRYHWRWILRAWVQAKGEMPERDGPPTQPTISRLLATFKPRYLARLMMQYGRTGRRSFFRDSNGAVHAADRRGAVGSGTDPKVE